MAFKLHDDGMVICLNGHWKHGPTRPRGCPECESQAAKTKRPYAQPNAKRRSIYTDAATWEALKKLGNGSASAGIREAVRQAQEREDEH